jgi:hypothetical protein
MVTKKAFVIALLVCSVFVFSSLSAFAAANWFTASVVSSTAGTSFQCKLTGTEDGGSRTFTNKTFLLYPPIQNQMLAVLLSAQGMGANVRVYVDPDAGTFPTIFGISMNSE